MIDEMMIRKLTKSLPEVSEIISYIRSQGIDKTIEQLNNKIIEKNKKYFKLLAKIPQEKLNEILLTIDKNLHLEVILSAMHKYRKDYYDAFIQYDFFREFIINEIKWWRDYFEL